MLTNMVCLNKFSKSLACVPALTRMLYWYYFRTYNKPNYHHVYTLRITHINLDFKTIHRFACAKYRILFNLHIFNWIFSISVIILSECNKAKNISEQFSGDVLSRETISLSRFWEMTFKNTSFGIQFDISAKMFHRIMRLLQISMNFFVLFCFFKKTHAQ